MHVCTSPIKISTGRGRRLVLLWGCQSHSVPMERSHVCARRVLVCYREASLSGMGHFAVG